MMLIGMMLVHAGVHAITVVDFTTPPSEGDVVKVRSWKVSDPTLAVPKGVRVVFNERKQEFTMYMTRAQAAVFASKFRK